MTNTPDRPPLQGETPQDWITILGRNRKRWAYGLLAVAVLTLIPVWMIYQHHWHYAAVAVWGGLLALISGSAGLWLLWSKSEEASATDDLRMLVLSAGGMAGFATWLLGLALAYRWWGFITGGLEAWQGPDWWRLWVCLSAKFGGLAVMFVSLLQARAVERSNPTLRRLLYGYNAVLGGLLVLAILMVVNVLVYTYLPGSIDATESGIYSLSQRSQNILRALEKPTKVYVLVPAGDDLIYREVHTLLNNCRTINDNLQVEYLSPDLNPERIRDLSKQYQFSERQGLLVVYGNEQQADHQFIKYGDIFGEDPDRSMSKKARFMFKGEDAVMSALNVLQEGKSRPVVYFTQGNGELDLNDADASQAGQGAGSLRERLQKGNYEVKGLQFGPIAGAKAKDPLVVVSNRVPDDAGMVVIAGPRIPLQDYALKALREYLNPPGADVSKKKGKLIVLLDLTLNPDKTPVQTGLEGLLAEFSVEVRNDRVLMLPNRMNRGDPTKVLVTPAARSRNPVAAAFASQVFLIPSVRTVQPRPSNPAQPGIRYNAEILLQAPAQFYVWAEANLRADVSQLVAGLDNEERLQEIAKKLSQDSLPVAVVVSEPLPPKGDDPHAFMRSPEQQPRLVVFGSSTFISNPYMGERGGGIHYDLFSSTLSWLRERPGNIGLEPKKRNIFVLNVKDDVIQRMHWLPAAFMFIGIIGLGTGVWLVRRR